MKELIIDLFLGFAFYGWAQHLSDYFCKIWSAKKVIITWLIVMCILLTYVSLIRI